LKKNKKNIVKYVWSFSCLQVLISPANGKQCINICIIIKKEHLFAATVGSE